MTPLRQRYIEDLRARNKSPRTIETYVLRVAQFAKHFGRSPELLGPEDLRAYQQHLITRQVSWSMFNQTVCALRFLYQVSLGRPEAIKHLPFAKRPRLVPTVLSPEEVAALLQATLPGRERTLLDVIYSCGLRLKEVLGLKVGDIDSARMVLHIRQGKGQKERLVPLSAAALACAERTLPRDTASIEPAAPPHCPHCGGQRFVRIALPKEEVATPTGSRDTS